MKHQCFPALLARIVPLVLCVTAAVRGEDLGTLAGNAGEAMELGKWDEALAICDHALALFGGDNPLRTFGPQFGAIYYRKGLCEMKLKRWNEAMLSFETCYRDFPNTSEADAGRNIFQKMALLKWGEAAMGAEQWELAISRFRKFLEERDRDRDVHPQGAFHINMAVCQYRTGHIRDGNESLEIALRNKENFPTPETGIIAGFQALVGAAIRGGNEQALLDFIGKNRRDLVVEPSVMHRYSCVFLKLGEDAAAAGMTRAAFALYQFVPSTQAALDDARARLKDLGAPGDGAADSPDRKTLQADIVALEAEARSACSPDMIKLAATAVLHEKAGNIREAYAAWQRLEACHQDAAPREETLFNLVRTSALAGSGTETRSHAEAFIKEFPASPKIPAVRGIMLRSEAQRNTGNRQPP